MAPVLLRPTFIIISCVKDRIAFSLLRHVLSSEAMSWKVTYIMENEREIMSNRCHVVAM